MRPLRLSVVIPAFNEAVRLPPTLRAVATYGTANLEALEIVVVDDGSRDATRRVAEDFATGLSNPGASARVISFEANRGKGAAVRAGMLAAKEPLVLMTDADLSTPIGDVEALAEALDGAEVAVGSRAVPGAQVELHQAVWRESMGKLFNRFVQALVVGGIRDTQCGFKLFRREAAQAIFSRARIDGFAFDVEAVYLAKRLGLRVAEVPVHWHNSPDTRVSSAAGGKAFLDLLKIRKLHRDLKP